MIIKPEGYTLSAASIRTLNTCDEKLIRIVHIVRTYIDICVVSGHRSQPLQDSYYARGLSKAPWPLSLHNVLPSMAVDIVPYHNRLLPVDYEDIDRFCFMAGLFMATAAQLHINIRWGGDWDEDTHTRDEKLRDYCHFELKRG